MAGSTTIGLDLASTCVRAAEVRAVAGVPRLERIGQMALPAGAVRDGEVIDPQAVADVLRELWRSVKFSHKKVVLGVANSRVVVRSVEVPWIAPSDLRASLRHVVGDQIPMPVEEAVLDLVPLEERTVDGRRMIRGLLVAAAEEMLMRHVEAVRLAGLRPSVIDLTSFALLRSLGNADPLGVEQTTEAIVDIGARVTSIVVHVSGRPQFVRMLPMGGQDVSRALMEQFSITAAQAEDLKREHSMAEPAGFGTSSPRPDQVIGEALLPLVDEVRGSLEYYLATARSNMIDQLTLSGGVARTAGLAERLQEITGVPVRYAMPLQRLELGKTGLEPEQLAYLEPMAGVPVGLALVAP